MRDKFNFWNLFPTWCSLTSLEKYFFRNNWLSLALFSFAASVLNNHQNFNQCMQIVTFMDQTWDFLLCQSLQSAVVRFAKRGFLMFFYQIRTRACPRIPPVFTKWKTCGADKTIKHKPVWKRLSYVLHQIGTCAAGFPLFSPSWNTWGRENTQRETIEIHKWSSPLLCLNICLSMSVSITHVGYSDILHIWLLPHQMIRTLLLFEISIFLCKT